MQIPLKHAANDSQKILIISAMLGCIAAAVALHSRDGHAFDLMEGTILLGRPTDTSISINVVPDTVNVVPSEPLELYFQYGTDETDLTYSTPAYYTEENPIVVTIDGLTPSTRYYYHMGYRTTGDETNGAWAYSPLYRFHTQRALGEPFVFTIQADPHLGKGLEASDDGLYRHTMDLVAQDEPDFHIDLGDTFMITINEDIRPGLSSAYTKTYEQYLKHRPFFGIVSHSAPIFLAIGNHENEEGWNLDDSPDPRDTYPMLSQNGRKRYYLNPVPDDFYSSVAEELDAIDGDHLRDTYYSFEWGDALFVILDPFLHTMKQPYASGFGQEDDDEEIGTPWDWTLGEKQYQWLGEVLRTSTAKYKFVFSHHVTGGSATDDGSAGVAGYGRGGASVARLFEWGGGNPDGTWGFSDQRSREAGWDTPIHQLMVETGVDIFFHGHDHLFAKENLDGIVYQECPRPDAQEIHNDLALAGTDYDTTSENTQPSSGYLRVSVAPEQATVAYVRSQMDGVKVDGEISHSYAIDPDPPATPPVVAGFSLMTDEDQILTFDFLGTDQEGDALTYRVLHGPLHGTITGDGPSVAYTPDKDWTGSDTLIYQANDGRMDGNIAYVSIMVSPVNDPPGVEYMELVTIEDTQVVIAPITSDVDGDPVTLMVMDPPANGTVHEEEGHLVYRPEPGFFGSDRFTCAGYDGIEIGVAAEIAVLVEEDTFTCRVTDEEGNGTDTEEIVVVREVEADAGTDGSDDMEVDTHLDAGEPDTLSALTDADTLLDAGDEALGSTEDMSDGASDADHEPAAEDRNATTAQETTCSCNAVGARTDAGNHLFPIAWLALLRL